MNKNQGFSLIELSLVLTITSIVIVGITSIIFHLVSNRDYTQDSMLSSEQIRSAHYWLLRDCFMSQDTLVGDDPETTENETLCLLWVGSGRKDAQNNQYSDLFDVRYFFENNQLSRVKQLTTGVYDSDGYLIDIISSNTTTLVAQNITDLVIASDNRTISFLVKAIVEDVENIKIFEVEPRTVANF